MATEEATKQTTSNGYVGRDQFLAAAKRRYTEATLAGFGRVRLQSLSEGERGRIESQTNYDAKKNKGDGIAKWRARWIIAAVVDGDGKRLFSDAELDTVQALDSRVTGPLYDIIAVHCGVDMDIEESEKN